MSKRMRSVRPFKKKERVATIKYFKSGYRIKMDRNKAVISALEEVLRVAGYRVREMG